MNRLLVGLGAAFGLLGVAAGAFAAHGLKSRLAADMLAIFETGARYQIYHALALVLAGLLAAHVPGRRSVAAAGWLFAAGIVIFSGSLYALALTGVRAFGAVTPFGGVAFLAGWASLAFSALARR